MKTLIIAEAGVNHNGDIKLAKRLIDEAVKANVDIIKFQTAKLDLLVSKNAAKADYQKQSTGADESQYEMLKKLILPFEDFVELSNYCKDKGIVFLSTPFDLESIDFLSTLDMPFWKIPSGEITNLPYLISIAQTKKPIILSTGMSTLYEIRYAVNILKDNGSGEIKLLHCTTEYPTPYEDVNLNAIKTIRDELNLDVGYSDHTRGIEVAIAAVAMGAVIIEKHFTLDKKMKGPDHRASLEPMELKKMVESIRNIEVAFGSSAKKPSESEIKNIEIARKSIIAKCNISKGEEFTENNLSIKRPGNGISPTQWYEVLGQKAIKNFEEDELIVL